MTRQHHDQFAKQYLEELLSPFRLHELQVARRSLGMVFQAAPKQLRQLILLTLISGAGPPVVLFLSKIIIDETSRLIGKVTAANPLQLLQQNQLLLASIIGTILLNLFTDSANTISNFVFASLRDRVQGFAEGKVLEKVANFEDIAIFETPELLNLVHLAEQGIERLKHLSFIIVTSLNGFFIFVPAVLLSSAIVWWVPLLLFLLSAPSVYIELKYRKKSWEVEETQATFTRYLNLNKNILMGETYAKELRLLNLQSLFLNRWQNLFQQILLSMEQVRRQGTLLVILWSMVSALGIGLPYIYVVLGALRGIYTLGDLALYAGLILQIRRSLYIFINNGSELYDVILGTRPIFQLLDLQPQLKLATAKLDITKPSSEYKPAEIAIKNLSFSYPGSGATQRKVLDNITLTIHPRETIALVGENGAGKSTLVKLLCRLYNPDAGSIYWQGLNLQEIDLTDWRLRIAIVLQDFAHFPLSIRENIAIGDLKTIDDENAIKSALNSALMKDFVEQLPAGLETLLGKELEGGIDLSKGQWQRLAIARTLIRLSAAELLIFDEPTAVLDPKAESEIYELLRQISRQKTTVIISHRLALAKLADRIAVLENGKIIELGSHQELMASKGRYYDMFSRQASSYSNLIS